MNFGDGDAPYLAAGARLGAQNTITPKPLSLAGNTLGLAVSSGIAYYAWGRGGWWRVPVVLGVVGALFWLSEIERQI